MFLFLIFMQVNLLIAVVVTVKYETQATFLDNGVYDLQAVNIELALSIHMGLVCHMQ